MAFQVTVTGVDALAQRQYLTRIEITRELYAHTQATLTWRWPEHGGYAQRSTAQIAGQALNCPLDVVWKDNDLTENVPCFHGYVQHASGQRVASSSGLTLAGISYSKRADLVPRHRAFQATTLLAIAEQVAKTEPRIKISNAGDLNKAIPLSLQYQETDFVYLARMCHAWGVPLAVVDSAGEVHLGARGKEAGQPFPDIGWGGWNEVRFEGHLPTLPAPASGGGGPTSLARAQHGKHLAQLSRMTADYMQTPERPGLRENTTTAQAHTNVSGYYVRAEGMVLPFVPGQVVSFEGAQHLLHKTRIVGDIAQTTATHELWLQPLTLPLAPHSQDRDKPHWPSRDVWAHVTANEHDPLQQGRVQVEFEWEHLDPQPSSERMWLHLVTPYGGGHAGGKKASAYSGFYSVPEVGERVLVEFLGEWDSEAVILGTVRHTSQKAPLNPKDTKRWATPSGNEVTMTTKGNDDVVRIRARGQLILDAHVGGGRHVSLLCHGSEADSLQIDIGDQAGTLVKLLGSNDMFIYAHNNLHIQAGNHLYLEGKQVSIHATDAPGMRLEAATGPLNLKAAANTLGIESKAGVTINATSGPLNTFAATTFSLAAHSPLHLNASTVYLNDGKPAPVKPLPPPAPVPPMKI